jgi:hypothetical protein
MPVHQLIYTSLSAHHFTDAELKKLLMRARMRNAERDITGMLVFHDGVFLQALEGEKEAVLDTFDRIRTDPRHRALDVLHRGAGSDTRVFGEWSMGFAGDGAALLKGFVRIGESLDLRRIERTQAAEILRSCAA